MLKAWLELLEGIPLEHTADANKTIIVQNSRKACDRMEGVHRLQKAQCSNIKGPLSTAIHDRSDSGEISRVEILWFGI